MLTLSERGVAFLKRFEGFEPAAYQDIAGVWTIGSGHTGPMATPGRVISEREGMELLTADVAPLDRFVDDFFGGWQSQWEHDAVVIFLYNVGEAAFCARANPATTRRASLMAEAIKKLPRGLCSASRSAAVRPLADAFLWWDKATVDGTKRKVRGLTRRRIEEAELLLYGDYELSDDGAVNAPGRSAAPDGFLEWTGARHGATISI